MKKQLRLVALGLLAGFLLAEVGLRIFAPSDWWRRYDTASPAESGRWRSHPFLPFIGQANLNLELKNESQVVDEIIRTNSRGFRTHEFPEFPGEKGPNDLVVLCFGGSTTYGYRAASNAATWPEILERKLAAEFPDKNVKVFNLGLDMATTAVSVVNMGLVGVHLNPDLVIVYHGYNDLDALGDTNHRTDHAHFFRDLAPETVFRGYQSWVPRPLRLSALLRFSTGMLDTRLGVNDLAQEMQNSRLEDPDRLRGIESTLRNLSSIRSMARGRGGEALFSTFQFRDGEEAHNRGFNARLREYFEDHEMLYVDQDALIPDGDPSINVDPCHFTPKGRELMAENFFTFIVSHDLLQ